MEKFVVALAIVMLASPGAGGASIPAACQAAKQQSAGALRQCLHAAERQLVLSDDPAAHGAGVTKCTSKFSALWRKAEQKAIDKGGSCNSTGDEAAVHDSIAGEVACLTSALETGDASCLTCGDGVIDGDAGEQCDLGTLGGATCATATGSSLAYGTLACTVDCAFDTSGCAECPGKVVGGFCWLLGGPGASCTTTCGAFGLAYDAATAFYAGHAGTNANCTAVLDALGASGGGMAPTGPAGVGCVLASVTNRARVRTTTTADAFSTSTLVRRACACR